MLPALLTFNTSRVFERLLLQPPPPPKKRIIPMKKMKVRLFMQLWKSKRLEWNLETAGYVVTDTEVIFIGHLMATERVGLTSLM